MSYHKQTPQPVKDERKAIKRYYNGTDGMKESDSGDWVTYDAHNFAICQHFDNWLIEKGALLTPHSEESDGPMAPTLNWIASVETMVAAPSGGAESLLRDAREALWQPSNPEICKRIDNFLDAARAASHVQTQPKNEHIAGDVSKSGQESNMSDAEDAARALFDAGWKACARFCDREDAIFDGIVGNTGCPQFEAAYDAARKEGNTP